MHCALCPFKLLHVIAIQSAQKLFAAFSVESQGTMDVEDTDPKSLPSQRDEARLYEGRVHHL